MGKKKQKRYTKEVKGEWSMGSEKWKAERLVL